MNKRYKSKLAMYRTVHDALMANGTKWEGIPAFVSSFQKFEVKLMLLEANELKQRTAIRGVRVAKEMRKKEIYEQLLRIVQALTVFANFSKDPVLREQVSRSFSSLRRSTNSDIIGYLDNLIAKAQEHATQLADFGISPDEIEVLPSLKEQILESILSTRKAHNDRSLSTSNIVENVKVIDSILLNEIDPLMETLRFQDPQFYFIYRKSRNIIELGSGPSNAA